jgi:hypothetical protein
MKISGPVIKGPLSSPLSLTLPREGGEDCFLSLDGRGICVKTLPHTIEVKTYEYEALNDQVVEVKRMLTGFIQKLTAESISLPVFDHNMP